MLDTLPPAAAIAMTTKQMKTLMQTYNKIMGLSVMDRILVKNLYFSKDYGAVRLINEFCDKE